MSVQELILLLSKMKSQYKPWCLKDAAPLTSIIKAISAGATARCPLKRNPRLHGPPQALSPEPVGRQEWRAVRYRRRQQAVFVDAAEVYLRTDVGCGSAACRRCPPRRPCLPA